MGIREKLEELRDQGLADIQHTGDLDSINKIRVSLLGKKGPITNVLRGMKDLSAEERPKVGKFANQVRNELQKRLDDKKEQIEADLMEAKLQSEKIDVTLPGASVAQGQPHVIQQVIDQVVDIFTDMGYQVAVGDEVGGRRGLRPADVVGVAHRGFARRTLLGGDEDHAGRSLGAVDGAG